jgi:hypothetical protein
MGWWTVTEQREQRADRKQNVRMVKPGDIDPMTAQRRRMNLPACQKYKTRSTHFCTRAAGHDDAQSPEAASHVMARLRDHVVVEVWHA